MILKNSFLRSPDVKNEGSNMTSENNDGKVSGNEQTDNLKEKSKHKKTIIDKVKDALQEWSNDDQQDQAFDDTRP